MKTKQLIKEINQYSDKLTEDHQKLFDKILLKIRFSKLNEQDAEEFSHHCLNLLLQAEEENKDASAILGTHDIDLFCNEYIDEVRSNYSMLKKVILILQDIALIIAIFSGVWDILVGYLIPNWIKLKTINFTVPISISMIVNAIFVYYIIKISIQYIPRISWDLNYGSKKDDHKWTFVIFLISCSTVVFFVISKLLLTHVLFEVHFLLFIFITIALYFILKVLGKNLD